MNQRYNINSMNKELINWSLKFSYDYCIVKYLVLSFQTLNKGYISIVSQYSSIFHAIREYKMLIITEISIIAFSCLTFKYFNLQKWNLKHNSGGE